MLSAHPVMLFLAVLGIGFVSLLTMLCIAFCAAMIHMKMCGREKNSKVQNQANQANQVNQVNQVNNDDI